MGASPGRVVVGMLPPPRGRSAFAARADGIAVRLHGSRGGRERGSVGP